jgi:hypothetical protein
VKKTFFAIIASSLLLGSGIGAAHAEICWKLTPFPDVIRVTEITDEGNTSPLGTKGSEFGSTHRLVFGNWIAHGFYTLPIVGAIEFDNSSTATAQKLRFGVHGTNHTAAFFGNHSDCTLDALLGGGWKLSCDGNVNTAPFNNSGSAFTLIDCENQPAFTAEGKPAGQQ